MTTDIKKLAERLRVAEVGEAFQTEDGSPELQRTELGLDAADALEAMAGEVELVRAERHRAQTACEQIAVRLHAAEAERDRLKAALVEAVKWMDGCAVSGGYPTWHAKARKALGGDAS